MRRPTSSAICGVDQTWGYAALGLAAHNVNGAYYLTPNNVNNGHPHEKYG